MSGESGHAFFLQFLLYFSELSLHPGGRLYFGFLSENDPGWKIII